MTFTVTRSGDLTEAVDVTYATSDGTAVQPADYTDTSGTVNFAVGVSSMMISVDIADNNAEATSELSFKVTLTGTTVGFLEDPEGIGTIVDDEGVSDQNDSSCDPTPPGVKHAVDLTPSFFLVRLTGREDSCYSRKRCLIPAGWINGVY